MATFNNNESNLSVRNKINAVLQHSDGTTSELVINEAGADVDFRVESDTNANAFFVDGATGNVGIGLSAPAVNLDIGGSSAPTVRTVSTTGAVDTRMVSFGGSGTAVFGTFSNHPLAIFANNGERARIHASGGVSINNPSDPGAGNLSVTGNILIPAATTEVRAIEIGVNRAGNGASFIDLIGDTTYGDYGARLARGATGANTETILYHRGTGALQLVAQDAGIVAIYTSITERMRIDADGNVGVGTPVPNAASIIDAQSTTKGVRFPNMTTTQKNAMANVPGNVIFDITLGKLCVNTGAGWQTITSA